MNLCWIVPDAKQAHVRDVDAADHAILLRTGYTEFRLVCSTPTAVRSGTLYIQAWEGDEELASYVEKAGFALFGGCTTIAVHGPDSTAPISLPHSDVAALISRHVS